MRPPSRAGRLATTQKVNALNHSFEPGGLAKNTLDMGGLPRAGLLSLLLHVALAALFMLTMGSARKERAEVYRVTLRPYAPPGAIQTTNPGGGPSGPSAPKPAEKRLESGSPKTAHTKEMLIPAKTTEKPEKKQNPQTLRKEKTPESPVREETRSIAKLPSEKAETPRKETATSLQNAIEDIHRKVALDNIRKKVAGRDTVKGEKAEAPAATGQTTGAAPASGSSKSLAGPSAGTRPGTGGNLETGAGSGPGYGPGTGGYPVGGVPWGSTQGTPGVFSKLDDYYSLIWAQVKKEWALPENLRDVNTDLEATVVIVLEKDGKLQKSWIEKRSGNALYDQRAMRAVAKAGPFPPIPRELGENTLEIAIRFHPD
jgi:TonB family protein